MHPSETLDRAASALARALLAWATGRLEPSRRFWLEALGAELGAIEGGGQQLAWAMGGLWLILHR